MSGEQPPLSLLASEAYLELLEKAPDLNLTSEDACEEKVQVLNVLVAQADVEASAKADKILLTIHGADWLAGWACSVS
jgi:hypothetical protein